MELHQVDEARMMESIELVVVSEIQKRIRDLKCGGHVNTWMMFEERMRVEFLDEFFYEDIEKLTKESFLNWVEQHSKGHMDPNKLLREFEKFNQLSMT
jgi:hypothetical protein